MLIGYQLPRFSQVNLKVYDIAGREVAGLTEGWRDAGYHEVTWDARDLPSGIYFLKIDANETEKFRKLVFIK